MKNISVLFVVVILFVFSVFQASAIPANPKYLKYTQPDGSILSLKVHGDEFLHWTTCGNSLVVRGTDGYYHYASFETDGVSSIAGGRLGSSLSGDGSSVKPPKAAIERARQKRMEWAEDSRKIRHAAAESNAVSGENDYLVLLIEFDDVRFTVPDVTNAFDRLLNQEGYSDFDGTGSVRDYFYDQSLGIFKPHFDVYGPITVSGKMISYSQNDGTTQTGAPRLLAEACAIADTEIDFSKYDHDGDGIIDNIFFYYAGCNSASGNPGTIWPHNWSVHFQTFTFDGVILYSYSCSSEYDGLQKDKRMASIGAYCHEFAHLLGLPDFYDTDYEENGQGYGLGDYSLMSSGNYNNDSKTPPYMNCEERMLLGWLSYVPSLPMRTTALTLGPVQQNNGYISPTETEGEYYYYEYRNHTGWDDSPELEAGLLIYHVDKSNNVVNGYTAKQRWDYWNGINANAQHECFKLILADNQGYDIPFGNDYTSFTSGTNPAAKSWSRAATGYDLTEISHDGNNASFFLTCAHMDMFSELGICAIEVNGTWSVGDTFPLQLIEVENNPPTVVEWYFDGEKVTDPSVKLNVAGVHTIKAEFILKNGETGCYETKLQVSTMQ